MDTPIYLSTMSTSPSLFSDIRSQKHGEGFLIMLMIYGEWGNDYECCDPTSVVVLGCVSWTVQDDYGGFDDRSSTATTVEECRTECRNNNECTAIDWVAGLSTGSQCWLVGPWTTWSGDRPGLQRHFISRTCGLQWLYICCNWVLRYIFLALPLRLNVYTTLCIERAVKSWHVV